MLCEAGLPPNLHNNKESNLNTLAPILPKQATMIVSRSLQSIRSPQGISQRSKKASENLSNSLGLSIQKALL